MTAVGDTVRVRVTKDGRRVFPISVERPRPQVLMRVWGSETLLYDGDDYTLKRLEYRAGAAGGLQYHRRKVETFTMAEGHAQVEFDNGRGELEMVEIHAGDTIHVPAGAVHRFYAVTDCEVYEASTPVHNDRVRCEEAYGVEVVGDAYGLETTDG